MSFLLWNQNDEPLAINGSGPLAHSRPPPEFPRITCNSTPIQRLAEESLQSAKVAPISLWKNSSLPVPSNEPLSLNIDSITTLSLNQDVKMPNETKINV